MSRRGKALETESRLVVARGSGREGEVPANEDSTGDDENVFGTRWRYRCTTPCVYLMPPIRAF